MRWRAALAAACCGLASFDAFADPAAQAFEIGVLIQLPVGSFIPLMLAAWILPAARLWWLRRGPPKGP